jgi:3-oxoacyl-[acyl-carrier protein] reductase
MANLTNKTALVTGASRGIGRATALAQAEAGMHILAHYGRSAQEAESLVLRSKLRADALLCLTR